MLIFFVLELISVTADQVILPSILWDPRNYLFACDNLAIKVGLNDQLNFLCPHKSLNTRSLLASENLEEKIYLLNDKDQYETCNSTGTGAKVILECNTRDFKYLNELYYKDAPPDERKYKEDTTYYYMSTSDGTSAGFNNRINGSCAGGKKGRFPLKLAVHICSVKDINDGKCKRCQTSSCYEEGCAAWNTWKNTTEYIWNGTQCLQKFTRVCISEYFKCEGDNVKYEVAERDNCQFYKYCPSTSVSTSIQPTSSFTCPPQTVSETVSVRTVTVFQTTVQVVPTTRLIVSTMISVTTSMSVSVSTSVSTVTSTSTVTETKTEACSATVNPPTAIPIRGDISYDSKFYITVVSAIIGALLVGIFVSHAILSYCKGKYNKTRVIEVSEFKPSPVSLDTGSTSKDTTNYQNGTHNTRL